MDLHCFTSILTGDTSDYQNSSYSVGPCVIPCAFFGKSVKHIFSCRKMYPD